MLTERDKKYLLKLKKKIIEKCPKCSGKDISCSCLDDYRLEFKKVKADIPVKYRNFTFDRITHPQTIAARNKVLSYIQNMDDMIDEGKGLFLWGTTGLAKSSLAAVVLIEALRKGIEGQFTTMEKALSLYVGRWKDKEVKEEFQATILDPDFLVIDEVGNEARTNRQFAASCLNDMLRLRANSLVPTIMTSNLDFNLLNKFYSDEVFSILHETTIPVEFSGIDFRQGIANT